MKLICVGLNKTGDGNNSFYLLKLNFKGQVEVGILIF